MRKFFGTDGVRGRVGQPPITPDFVMKLGYCAGKVLSRADVAPPHRSRPRRPCRSPGEGGAYETM